MPLLSFLCQCHPNHCNFQISFFQSLSLTVPSPSLFLFLSVLFSQILRSVWLEVLKPVRVAWRSITVASGGQFATISLTHVTRRWSAVSWATRRRLTSLPEGGSDVVQGRSGWTTSGARVMRATSGTVLPLDGACTTAATMKTLVCAVPIVREPG